LQGGAVHVAIQALHASPSARDRLAAVLVLDGEVSCDESQKEWMAEHFTHAAMDTELNRTVPWFSLVLVDPDDPLDFVWSERQIVAPEVPQNGWCSVDAIDLGVLPRLWQEKPEQLARALWVTMAFRFNG